MSEINNSTSSLSDEQFEAMPVEEAMQRINNAVDNYAQEVNEYNQEQEQQNYNQDNSQYSEEFGQQQQQQEELNPEVYKEAYDYIMQPFKAAGKEFQLRDFHEARGLMQQGIDYTKKQQQLKPRLMEMRALEQANMLGNNINYAIDLFNGKPEAVAKLIKDKNINVDSLFNKETDEFGNPITKESSPYVPTEHRISEKEYEIGNVIQDIKNSPQHDKITKYLSSIDNDSGAKYFNNPKDLQGLKYLVEEGIHDDIIREIDYLRAVNNPVIAGLNDYDAYSKVGANLLQQRYQQLQQQRLPQQQYGYVPEQYPQTTNYQQQINPVQQQQMYQQYQQQMQMQQRKQSVSPVRNNNRVMAPKQYDPLFANVSDEDFAKINLDDLMRN